MTPDFYRLLGLPRSASRQQIKSAFHKLIVKYHPDRNPEPRAAEYARLLTVAYSTLCDDRKRRLYDEWLRATASNSQAFEGSASEEQASAEAAGDIRCSRCGRKDSSLRLACMYYALSLVLVTSRRGSSGIWCERCRCIEAAKWTLVSGILGWWSVPWGPIYTIQALWVNARGGLQPQSNNAVLLRILGYQLYAEGRHSESISALAASLRLQPNAQADSLLEYLRSTGTPEPRPSSLMWRFAAVMPSLLVTAGLSGVIFLAANQLSASRAGYQRPSAISFFRGELPGGSLTAAQQRANAYIEELKAYVADHAAIVGTHYQGADEVKERVLDRSKLDSRHLYSIADKIHRELVAAGRDPNGFAAHAYFNAELFALSADMADALQSGREIAEQVVKVEALGRNGHVARWLLTSRFRAPYEALQTKLRQLSSQYRPGSSVEKLVTQYEAESQELGELEERMGRYKDEADTEDYQELARSRAERADSVKELAATIKLRAQAIEDLDVAFNRCIDTEILLSKFNRVDLTSNAGAPPSRASADTKDDQDTENTR